MSDEQHHTIRYRYALFGNSLAAGVSFAEHHSILWALWHGSCGWAYLAYWAVGKYAA